MITARADVVGSLLRPPELRVGMRGEDPREVDPRQRVPRLQPDRLTQMLDPFDHPLDDRRGLLPPPGLGRARRPNHITFIQQFIGIRDKRWRPYLFLD